jgi:hypothetical protein
MADRMINEAVTAFEQHLGAGISVTPDKGTAAFRQVQVDGWPPRMLHFEFITDKKNGRIGAELHIEHDETHTVRNFLPALRDDLRQAIPFGEVLHDPGWFENRGGGRIRVLFSDSTDSHVIAQAMSTLVEISQPRIEEAVRAARRARS